MTASHARILLRPRVAKALSEAVAAHPLVAVSAPMGYGKTTAARELAESAGENGYYVAVPAGPASARYLWDAALGQLADQGLKIAPALRRLGFPEDAAQMRRVMEMCRADSYPAVVIFDDYQHVTDPALDLFLDLLVRERLPNFHIALFSRVRPNLPLEELRLKGLAAAFGQELLAFTREEAEEYFRLHKSPEAAEDAWNYSEGWVSALWLSLQSWRKTGTARPERDAEILVGETVFSSYDEREKALLMQLSIVDRFTAGEAAILAADPGAANLLRGLHDKNAFLDYDPAGDSYQLHSIFRSYLNKALDASGMDMRALRRRAGECSLARGEPMPALRFFAGAGREEDLLRILDAFALPGGNLTLFFFPEEVMAMVKAIPWRILEQRPMEYLAFVYFCLSEAADPTAATLLEEAEERFAASDAITAALKKRIGGEAILIRSMLAFNDLWAMRDIHRKAHKLLNGRSAISSKNMIWTFGCPHVAYLYLRKAGTYRNMIELIEGNLHYFHDLTGGCSMGAEPLFRAEWLLERGELDRVEGFLANARGLAETKDQITTLLAAAFSLARLRIAENRPGEATALLDAWLPVIQDAGHVDHFNCLALATGYVNACLGRHDRIPQWLRDGDIWAARHVVQMLGFIYAVHGKAIMLAGDCERLDALAKRLPAYLGPYDNLFGHIHAKTLEAVAAWRLQGMEKALEHARAAVELARPDGILLTLAEYGQHFLPLAQRLRDETPNDAYLAALARATEHYSRTASRIEQEGNGKVSLTGREKDILRLVVKGKTNADIAKRLGVAEITVKKMLTSAFSKLKVKNRIEAAQRFSEKLKIS